MSETYDFSGYATKNDLRCADGRTIRKNAFKECDGVRVPLVWQHRHGTPGDVLGHALLENREDGVYAYGSFNDTESGKNAKELVRHGDVKALSIYANQLVQKGGDVIHGMIREVSLCLAGANPGAMIEDLSFEHFDDEGAEFEAMIYNGENIELYHSEEDAEALLSGDDLTPEEVFEQMSPDQQLATTYMVEMALQHSAESQKTAEQLDENASMLDIFNTLNPMQKDVVMHMIRVALEQGNTSKESDDDDEEEEEMKHNSYEGTDFGAVDTNVLLHDAMDTIVADGKRFGSLKESYNFHAEEGALAHAIDTTGMTVPTMSNTDFATNVGYGVNDFSLLFPDARPITPEPIFIQRDMDWVQEVWNGVKRVPYSRIKSLIANITEDEARAKGYIKGNMKKEEFFSVMSRVTVPQTVYKKQKIDKDDINDIVDFDVVKWIRGEMRLMWDEETARAMLIGDGRSSLDSDRISPEHIRPIAEDLDIFSIKAVVTRGADEYATAKNFMRLAVRARKDYKGSGNPILFTTEDMLTSMLLLEDGIGHTIYKSESELATALRVRKIVTVPVMEGHKLENGNELLGIIVNLNDYTVGTDKGGEVSLFDDFDIDYNQYKYLIESRCSGTLVKPYSAIVLSAPAVGD